MPLKLVRRGERWYIRGAVRGQAVFESTGTGDRGLAEAARAKREAELFQGGLFGRKAVASFAEAATSYLTHRRPGPAEVAYVRRLLDHFAPGWQTGAHSHRWRLLSAIDQAAIDLMYLKLLAPDAAPATKARLLSVVQAIMNHAARRGMCARPAFEKPRLPRGRLRWLAPDEATRLLEASAPHLRPLLHFVLCTGARLAEALELAWEDIDLAAAQARFHETKNGTMRVAALPEAAVVTLANLEGKRQGAVFRRPDGKAYADRGRLEGGQIKTAFKGAVRRAGLGWRDGKAWRTDVTPHVLRHSWATWFYGLTHDLLLLKDEGGWQSVKMVERYAKLMRSDQVLAIAAIWGASHPRIGLVTRAESVHPPVHRQRKRSR